MARYQKKGGTTYGKKFRTRAGRYGSYKYVNGRRVGFVSSKRKSSRKQKYWLDNQGTRRYRTRR